MNRMTLSALPAVAVGLWLTGCAAPPKTAIHAEDYRGTVRVACVGDSITYGAGIENREVNCYPAVLGRLLGSGFEVRNFGVSGATLLKRGDSPYWDLPEFQAVTQYAPDVIVLMLGTNDTKPQNWRHQEEFAADLVSMLGQLAQLPSHPKIWICLPVPVYETRWGINEATLRDEVIPVIQRVAREKRLPTIDLHRSLSDCPDHFPDKIHPNAAGAAAMAMGVYVAFKGR